MSPLNRVPRSDERADLAALADTLQEAMQLLSDSAYVAPPSAQEPPAQASLLQQCLDLCAQHRARRPEPVRTLHHLACTGGTLIAKCIAALPNVQLLSEVDPLSPIPFSAKRPGFAPTDMVRQLRQSTRGTSETLIVDLFRAEIRLVHADATAGGQRLVVRDHAHSHFCTGDAIPTRPSLRELLPPEIETLSVVTVRHPADSFAALQRQGWLHFKPSNLAEYARRYLCFLDRHAGSPWVRYEDFVATPASAMRQLCDALDLAYVDGFEDLFGAFNITGDSGRSGTTIAARESTAEAVGLSRDGLELPDYLRLVERLGYPPNLTSTDAARAAD